MALLGAAAACRRIEPASFWATYRPEAISAGASDQGPWGGWRWIAWEAGQAGAFAEADVRSFAERNGWTLLDRRSIAREELESWVHPGAEPQPTFRELLPGGEGESVLAGPVAFPRSISTDSTVLRFSTSWTRLDLDSGELIGAPGYVHLAADGSRMAVYHVWGE